MKKVLSSTICFMLLALAVSTAWAIPHFIVISNFGDISFLGYENSWDDPAKNLEQDLNTTVKDVENRLGRPLTTKEIGDLRSEMLKKFTGSSKRGLTAHLVTLNYIVYRLGIQIPDKVNLRFNGPGALKLILRGGDGQPLQVPDAGIILIKKHKPADDWINTRNNDPVLMDNHFNKGAPPELPNVVLVCLPRAYYGLPVIGVEPTDKFSIEDHRAKVTFQ
jgi:hypothetical protein